MNVKLAMVIWLMLVIVVMGTTLIFYAIGAKMTYTEALQYEAIVFGIALLVIAAYLFSTKSSDKQSSEALKPLLEQTNEYEESTEVGVGEVEATDYQAFMSPQVRNNKNANSKELRSPLVIGQNSPPPTTSS